MAMVATPRKEGDTKWAHQYLLDPLNSVEAWQTAQTGGQYDNRLPTQHKQVTADQYYANSGLGRSKSQRVAGTNEENSEPRRSNSVRNRLIRHFSDEGKDRRYTNLRPLNEVPEREVQRMGNTNSSRIPSKEVQSPKEPASNNPFRDSMKGVEAMTPPSSPGKHSPTRTSTNPFRDPARSLENRTPPRSPPRPSSRNVEPRAPSRSASRSTKGAPPPYRPASRNAQKPRPKTVKTLGTDTIDILDSSFYGLTFHHEGPYDATLSHRNKNPHKSPVEATKYGNQMALKATAKADIENSLTLGRPLDGTAAFPPGSHAPGGEVLDYEEYDVNTQEGAYKRWPGLKYRDEDLKGKGIVGYDGDLKEKQQKEWKHARGQSLDLNTMPSETNREPEDISNIQPMPSTGLKRGGSTAGRLEGAAAKLKRKFSLKRR